MAEADDNRLYCDRCPRAIEVSYYDPVLRREVGQLLALHSWEQVMAAIEPLLGSCRCGGLFRGLTLDRPVERKPGRPD